MSVATQARLSLKCQELQDGVRCGLPATRTIIRQDPEFITPKLVQVPACATHYSRQRGR